MSSIPTGAATNPMQVAGVGDSAVCVATEAAGTAGLPGGTEIAPTRQ